jgi:type II secretory pathway pseudopilin PulG
MGYLIKNIKQQTGFTLMEVVVATGIFVIMVMVTLGIFSSVLKAQQDTVAQTRLEREAQLIMETIVKSIRSSRVDYDEYSSIDGSVPQPTSTLILINSSDQRIRYQLNPTNQTLDVENSGVTNPMTSDSVLVTDLDFFVLPADDPFINWGEAPDTQPRVTIVLTLYSSQSKETAQATIQQTVPQRGGGY